ncbi:branched-chain amino acid ABC transporter permease [Aeromicrobium fastidiosum]|uniref:branched-chain amino acid ABC transporter permease n=1 Tax=Aeromicrobium TaxID=2040 RepID=UPI001782542C|nr:MULTISPECIES: branched-chain amino acid ABC transporter permease [Aeromicrobium]MBD8605491.1 branched-chain amino acid ABC transporter permease [Aeromicrobium sp. CFBP 8757]MCL8250408.1 branched-chain amino acid ABC transporter permease [Aeromicrobium fastidiosum]
MTNWFLVNAPLIQTFSVLALLGYSVQLAVRAGVLSFATIGFYAVGGYVSAHLLKEEGWPAALVLMSTVLLGGVLAVIMSPMLTRLKALYLAMATLAVTLFIQALAQSWEGFTGGAQGMFLIPRVLPQWLMLILVAAVVALAWYTQRGAWGRAVTTLREDDVLSAALGIRVTRYQAVAFVISAMVGSLAGFVQVSTVGVFGPTDVGFSTVVASLTVMVLGGTVVWIGPLMGAALLALMPVYLTGTGSWNLIIQALVLLAVVVYQPDGLAGLLRAVWNMIGKVRRTSETKHVKERVA